MGPYPVKFNDVPPPEQEAKPHDNKIGHYQATVGGLYKACRNMVTCHSVVS